MPVHGLDNRRSKGHSDSGDLRTRRWSRTSYKTARYRYYSAVPQSFDAPTDVRLEEVQWDIAAFVGILLQVVPFDWRKMGWIAGAVVAETAVADSYMDCGRYLQPGTAPALCTPDAAPDDGCMLRHPDKLLNPWVAKAPVHHTVVSDLTHPMRLVDVLG